MFYVLVCRKTVVDLREAAIEVKQINSDQAGRTGYFSGLLPTICPSFSSMLNSFINSPVPQYDGPAYQKQQDGDCHRDD